MCNFVLVDLVIQCPWRNTEQLCRILLNPFADLKGFHYGFTFDIGQIERVEADEILVQ